MMRAIGAAVVSAGLVLAGACKRTDTDQTSSQKAVEEAQRESENAFDQAKEAQEKARKEQEDVQKAEQRVLDKQRELAEAQAKAQQERVEAEEAQAQATAQGQQAAQQAQSAQARAEQAQQQARTEAETRQQGQQAPTATTTHTAPVTTESTTEQPAVEAPGQRGYEARQTQMQRRSTNSPVKQWFDKWAGKAQNATDTSNASNAQSDTSVSTSQRATTTSSSTSEAAEPLQHDEGIVSSVNAEELVLTRDNGSQLKIQMTQSLALPELGDRVNVEYKLDGSQPVAVRIAHQ